MTGFRGASYFQLRKSYLVDTPRLPDLNRRLVLLNVLSVQARRKALDPDMGRRDKFVRILESVVASILGGPLLPINRSRNEKESCKKGSESHLGESNSSSRPFKDITNANCNRLFQLASGRIMSILLIGWRFSDVVLQ